MTTLNFRKIKTITYKPGKSKLFNTMKAIKLSANESALGMSSKAKKFWVVIKLIFQNIQMENQHN